MSTATTEETLSDKRCGCPCGEYLTALEAGKGWKVKHGHKSRLLAAQKEAAEAAHPASAPGVVFSDTTTPPQAPSALQRVAVPETPATTPKAKAPAKATVVRLPLPEPAPELGKRPRAEDIFRILRTMTSVKHMTGSEFYEGGKYVLVECRAMPDQDMEMFLSCLAPEPATEE